MDMTLDRYDEPRHPTKHDFVLIEPQEPQVSTYTGVVHNVVYNDDDEPSCYSVQLWNQNGPQSTVLYFDPCEVAIHPEGRLAVMDNSSKHRFKER